MDLEDTAQSPLSTAPSLNVAGFFLGGGSAAQQLNDRERNLEVDEDLIYTHKRETWKIGAQSLGIFVHETDPNTFNGAFTFAGGAAPVLDASNNPTGATTTISGLEQYRRALLNLPGGTPTTYSVTTGTALVPVTQWQLAAYAEDTVKLSRRLSLSGGLRYALQTAPSSYANFAPRAGLAWALDKRSKTVVHLHAGLFSSVLTDAIAIEDARLNGTRQTESVIYSPSFTTPLVPTSQSLDVTTLRFAPPSPAQVPSFQSGLGIEHDFPHHWHAQANFYSGESWDQTRDRNINAPELAATDNTAPNLAAALAAPRPIAPNENLFQFQNTGHLSGKVLFLGLDQHSYKRFAFFLGYLNFNFTRTPPPTQASRNPPTAIKAKPPRPTGKPASASSSSAITTCPKKSPSPPKWTRSPALRTTSPPAPTTTATASSTTAPATPPPPAPASTKPATACSPPTPSTATCPATSAPCPRSSISTPT